MESYLLSGLFLGFVMVNMLFASGGGQDVSFSQNYNVGWGHFSINNKGTEVELTLDQSSGGGFESKLHLLSGLINWRIKLPESKSPGVITAFYLTSKEAQHDEIDFEFIGTNGPPYRLSTNVFTKGVGGREQSFNLWFDPSADFHSYTILWNQYQVVFFVDEVPIRVFKNLGNPGNYPTQGMLVEGSLWDGGAWAGKIDWSKAPFRARFQGFDVDGCVVSDPSKPGSCGYTHGSAWAQQKTLNAAQMTRYQNARSKYLNYDYCKDRSKYPQPPPECNAQIGI